MSVREKLLLLFVLGVAPALLGLATFALSFQRAEQLRFCASCHTMTPWVADLEDPNSISLASKHYRNRWILNDQCYTCHVNYKFMGPVDPAVLNKAAFAALKPGGIYLIVDHVADAGSGARDTDTLHRIDPAIVKTQVAAAGFQFVGESKLLVNPADDHTKKVFDKSIRGKTDQFIYKFRKPG